MALNIYKPGSEPLRVVLQRASGSNATWVIPDLQRPYVWKPEQVVRLLDSILKGWPFGTLLILDTGEIRPAPEPGGDKSGERIPFRGLWTFVDRVGSTSRETSLRAPPTGYMLVLDGQQRLQSLALALGDDSWGFRLSDSDWQESLEVPVTSGSHGRWSDGQLHLSLKTFAAEHAVGRRITEHDFEKSLVWVRSTPGQNHGPLQDTAEAQSPLPGSHNAAGPFIRLGRLWERAVACVNSQMDDHDLWVTELLNAHDVTGELADVVHKPLTKLIAHLAGVADMHVHFLQLYAQSEANLGAETYDDAVVNVFARLNSAGRVLTRQEITFAWVKRKWDQTSTGLRAEQAFDELRRQMAYHDLDLDADQLVSLCAAAWCAITPARSGRLLQTRDLMRANEIKPLAAGLSKCWPQFQASFVDVAARLKDRDLILGDQILSFNAIVVLAVWMALAREWLVGKKLNPSDLQAFEHGVTRAFDRYADRWLFCARWGRLFNRDTADTLEGFTVTLSTAFATMRASAPVADVMAVWARPMDGFVTDAATKATPYVRTHATSSRNAVSQYASLLWVWNRLSQSRYQSAKVLLRTSLRQRPNLHVDHLVPWAWFTEESPELFNSDGQGWRDVGSIGNDLGNMAHLKSNLNQQKSDQTLSDFLVRCADSFKATQVSTDTWLDDLAVAEPMRNALVANPLEVRAAIEARSIQIRADLLNFCEGTLRRVDVSAV